jgi:hypothetical protein
VALKATFIPPSPFPVGAPTLFVSYSDIEGGADAIHVDPYSTLIWEGGNIDADPCFLLPGYWEPNGTPGDANDDFWVEGDYRLGLLSPCIDTGDPNYTAEPNETDVAGRPRLIGGCIDMGAFESDYLEVPVRFTPQTLNPCSRQRWIKAHCVLPAPLTTDDVDSNEPVVIYPFRIEAADVNIFINDQNSVEIVATFARSNLPPIWTMGTEPLEMLLTGSLVTGRRFYGVGSVTIVQRNLRCLAALASHWLQPDCNDPNWCDGLDLDQNGAVNFADLALSNGCCIEVLVE